MALYFVRSGDGNDGDAGNTLDDAWATIEHALEAGGLSAGDVVVICGDHSETPTSDILPAYDGTISAPIYIWGLPRPVWDIASSDWTNGSTSVTVDDNDMTKSEHQTRYITAPDGETYLITRVSASDTIIIDREYAGSTANNQAVTIQADPICQDWEDYDDSGDVIKKADWEAIETRPVIDFNDGDFQVYMNAAYHHVFYNIHFMDSTDSEGIFRVLNGRNLCLEGCLFTQSSQDDPVFQIVFQHVVFKRCTIEGSGAGGNQKGIYCKTYNGGSLEMIDCAIYNMGDNGIDGGNLFIKLDNVNIGVEQANGDDDIFLTKVGAISGIDVSLGGTNGTIDITEGSYFAKAAFQNYNKTQLLNRVFYEGGYYDSVAVSGETPNKKNSDYVIKIIPNINVTPTIEEWMTKIPIGYYKLDAGTYTLTYDIYNDSGVTINNGDAKADLFLMCEFISEYEDTSEYVRDIVYSTEHTIADAADADDWDSLSVTFTTDTTCICIVYAKISFYSAAGTLFIDTLAAVT